MSSPILDLSYRNYDGPLHAPKYRWWPIAKTTMRIAMKKKAMWICMALSAWYYFAMIFILFIMDQIVSQAPVRPGQPNPMEAFFARIVWKDQFMHAFSYGQIMYLAVVLFLGAGAIANDNRANALLVYLSKPVTKLDYLIGKWMGVFVPVFLTMVIPAAVFYLYGLMSYRDKGFVSQDAWLFVKVFAACVVASGFHASLVVGVSSFFSQGRLAGAAYAGFYFLSNFFTHLMGLTYMGMSGAFEGRRRGGMPEGASGGSADLVSTLFYGSVDGTNIGFLKSILNTAGSMPFGMPGRGFFIKAPPLWMPLLIIGVLSTISMLVAWRKIKAVEVIGG